MIVRLSVEVLGVDSQSFCFCLDNNVVVGCLDSFISFWEWEHTVFYFDERLETE